MINVDKSIPGTTRIICPPGTSASPIVDAALASIKAETFTFDYHVRENGTEVFTIEECHD